MVNTNVHLCCSICVPMHAPMIEAYVRVTGLSAYYMIV